MTTTTIKKFCVHVAFIAPAWDEVDGLDIEVWAKDRAAAIKAARREMQNAGHGCSISRSGLGPGGLRYTSCRLAETL